MLGMMRSGRRSYGGGGGDKNSWIDNLLIGFIILIFAGGILFSFYMAHQESRWITVSEEFVNSLLVDKHRDITGHGSLRGYYFKVRYNGKDRGLYISYDFFKKYDPGSEVPLCLITQVRDYEKRERLRQSCSE